MNVLIDITLKITPRMVTDAQGNEKKTFEGHLGTRFDVMNKEFPLEYTERQGIVFDASHVTDRDIDIADIDIGSVERGMFVAFHTGFVEKEGYGTPKYYAEHPQLSNELIDALIENEISIIGIDFAGVRRGREHTPKDQYCADKGIFIIENLCNLKALLSPDNRFIANTYPINYTEMTGLPCRVVAKK
jgi:kynurenine formamidase